MKTYAKYVGVHDQPLKQSCLVDLKTLPYSHTRHQMPAGPGCAKMQANILRAVSALPEPQNPSEDPLGTLDRCSILKTSTHIRVG